jgi:hypothetical protein
MFIVCDLKVQVEESLQQLKEARETENEKKQSACILVLFHIFHVRILHYLSHCTMQKKNHNPSESQERSRLAICLFCLILILASD